MTTAVEQIVNRVDDAVAALEDLALSAGRIARSLETLAAFVTADAEREEDG